MASIAARSLRGAQKLLRNRLKSSLTTRSLSASVQDDPSLWVQGILPDVELIKGVTVQEYSFEKVGLWENATAFECALSGRKYTYGQLHKLSKNFGAALQNAGLKRGDVLATVMPNIPEFPIVLNGTWWAGCVITTVNPLYTTGEITTQLKDCDAKCIVTVPLFLPLVQQVVASSPQLSSVKIIVIGEEIEEGCHSFMDMLKTDSSSAKLYTGSQIDTQNDTAALLYSSGTTGMPKGCMLTHYSLLNNVSQFIPALTTITPFTDGNKQGKAMGLLPFFHIMGFQAFNLTSMRYGGHVVCLPVFDPDLFIETLRNNKFTALHLVTPLISFILGHPGLTSKEFENVENIYSGAAPSGEAMIKRLLEKIGHDINFQEGYGLTEMSPISHSVLPSSNNTKVGSIGVPISSTICKIIDVESGKTLGPKEKGEICLKGPQIFKGYLNNDEATKETIKDGWLHTGDIGYYGDDKYFYIVDRLKELIKVKGLQVAPSELEAVLREHPKIADAAVIGIPHTDFGELPRAYVVKKDDSLSEAEVSGYIKERLSKHKHLAGGVDFIDAVPKAPSGKILRKTLKEEYLESLKS